MALSDNLVYYYSCEEASGDLIDAHGSNDLTDFNTVGSATGIVGNARDFEASNSEYFMSSSNSDLQGGDIDMTWAAWVKMESTASYRVVISKDGGSQWEYQIYYRNSDQRFVFYLENTGGSIDLAASSFGTPSTATTYFICCRYDANANLAKISVNGVEDTSSFSGGTRVATNNFYVGRESGGSYWDGLIDEIGFWKRHLTDAEVTELYNSGAGRSYNYVTGGAATTRGRPFGQRGTAFNGGRTFQGIIHA